LNEDQSDRLGSSEALALSDLQGLSDLLASSGILALNAAPSELPAVWGASRNARASSGVRSGLRMGSDVDLVKTRRALSAVRDAALMVSGGVPDVGRRAWCECHGTALRALCEGGVLRLVMRDVAVRSEAGIARRL
jgi:hypothetical protein